MTSKVTVFVEGTVYWAKIVGDGALHDNYDGDAREWAYELVPDDTSFLKENRLLDRLKDKQDPHNPDKCEYLNLRKPELTKDGEKNKPILIINNDDEVTDDDGDMIKGWDGRLIGNGTRVVAKLQIVNWGKGKKSSIYTQALRVEKLVPYEGGDAFGDYEGGDSKKSEDKKPTPKPKTKRVVEDLEDLDDDVPF